MLSARVFVCVDGFKLLDIQACDGVNATSIEAATDQQFTVCTPDLSHVTTTAYLTVDAGGSEVIDKCTFFRFLIRELIISVTG
jgi:hypothetical protein